jgi:hypothetical protein
MSHLFTNKGKMGQAFFSKKKKKNTSTLRLWSISDFKSTQSDPYFEPLLSTVAYMVHFLFNVKVENCPILPEMTVTSY